jgi:hypothetical protein
MTFIGAPNLRVKMPITILLTIEAYCDKVIVGEASPGVLMQVRANGGGEGGRDAVEGREEQLGKRVGSRYAGAPDESCDQGILDQILTAFGDGQKAELQ